MLKTKVTNLSKCAVIMICLSTRDIVALKLYLRFCCIQSSYLFFFSNFFISYSSSLKQLRSAKPSLTLMVLVVPARWVYAKQLNLQVHAPNQARGHNQDRQNDEGIYEEREWLDWSWCLLFW